MADAVVSAWIQALLVVPRNVCGQQLKPFSLFHSLILAEVGNPYLCGGDRSIARLCEAAFICSKSASELRCGFISVTDQSLKRYGRRLKSEGQAYETESAVMEAHVEDYWRTPQRAQYVKAKRSAVPWQYQVVRVLCAEYGMTTSDAWDMPVGEAVCYCDAFMAWTGDECLMTPDDIEFDQAYEEAEKLREAGLDPTEAEARAQAALDRKNGRA